MSDMRVINGAKIWELNGVPHRIGGPAIEYITGTRKWYYFGKCHRLDGPAIEWSSGDSNWFHHDQWVDIRKPIWYEGRKVFLSTDPLEELYPSAVRVNGFQNWYHLDNADETLFALANTA